MNKGMKLQKDNPLKDPEELIIIKNRQDLSEKLDQLSQFCEAEFFKQDEINKERFVCVAFDGGKGGNFKILATVIHEMGKLPFVLNLTLGISSQEGYAKNAASIFERLKEHNITVVSYVTDGLPYQVAALRPPNPQQDTAEQNQIKEISQNEELENYVKYIQQEFEQKEFDMKKDNNSSESEDRTLAFHSVCWAHLVQLAFQHAAKSNEILSQMLDTVSLIVTFLRKMPYQWKQINGICPRGVQTRWLCACIQLKWMIARLSQIEAALQQANNPEIKVLRTDFFKPLHSILSPLLDLVTAVEGNKTSLSEIFPMLVLTFEKLKNVQLSFPKNSEYYQISSTISQHLFKLSLDSDNGAMAALAFSFTPPGQ
ncbi:MAG: hypothetical protein EZS28_026645, partial [Streblomastix strix]